MPVLFLTLACGDEEPMGPAAPVVVTVSPALARLDAIGDSVRLMAEVRDGDGVVAGAAVEWSSADDAVATVDASGWVVAKGNGTVTVEARVGNASDEAGIVVDQAVASVQVSPGAASLGEGDTLRFAASALDGNGVAVDGAAPAWSSGDPGIAVVGGTGLLRALREGRVEVLATAHGVSGAAVVTVLGRIAFASFQGDNDEIYVMNEDGTGPAALTTSGANDDDPAWSPDGGRVSFVSTRDGNEEIYVMNANGTEPTNLTSHIARDVDPAWSPDGTKIAFASFRDGNWEIYVMNADGTRPTRLTNDAALDWYPVWSPDGTRIAFAGEVSGNRDIYVMNADGSGQTALTSDGALDDYAAWSPDGTKLAFASLRDGDWDIYVMNADGTGQTPLTNNTAFDADPTWSPDGTQIAFTSNRDGGFQIFVMNADGTGVTKLSNGTRDDRPMWRPRPRP